MYKFNIFSVPSLFCSAVILFLAFYTLFKKPRDKSYLAFFYFCLSLIGWNFGMSLAYCSTTPELAMFWSNTTFMSVAFISSTNLYFNTTLFDIRLKKWILLFQLLASVTFCFLASPYSLIYDRVHLYMWGYYPQATLLHSLFLLYFFVTWGYGFYLLYKEMKKKKQEKNFEAYNQIKYIFIAWLGAIVGAIDYLPKYGINIFPFGCLVSVYWTSICARFLFNRNSRENLNFFNRRILIGCYVIVALVFCFSAQNIFLENFEIESDSKLLPWTMIVLGSMATVFFYALYYFTRHFVDHCFFPEYCDREDNLVRLGTEISSVPTQEQYYFSLLKNVYTLFGTMKCSLFVLAQDEKSFEMVSACECGIAYPVKKEIPLIQNQSLVKYLTHQGVLDFENMQNVPGIFARDIKRLLLWVVLQMEANLIVPILVDGKLSSFIVLGGKESGLTYSEKDKKDLMHIAGLAAVVTKSNHFYHYQIELRKMVEEKNQELKNAQKELLRKEKLAALGTLSSEISHELRNPLRSFEINVALLEKKLRQEMNVNLLSKTENLKHDIKIMKRTISNMLDYCRSRKLILENWHLNSLIYECLGLTEICDSIQVKTELSVQIQNVLIDVHQMRQAILNLLANACEAMPNGGELLVQTKLTLDNQIEINISDTGCGIDPELVDHIFEPFCTTKICGNGLGMAVVKKAIENHQGSVNVKSQLGVGSAFCLRFPVRYAKLTEDTNNEQQSIGQKVGA